MLYSNSLNFVNNILTVLHCDRISKQIMQVQGAKIKHNCYLSQSDDLPVIERRSSVVRLIGSEVRWVTGLHMSLEAIMKG